MKCALVTGSSRGIGKAVAETFAKENANIAICARNETQLTETTKMLKDYGVKFFRTDECGDIEIITDGISWWAN